MRTPIESAAGVTYIGPRSFVIAFCALGAIFIALVFGLDRFSTDAPAVLSPVAAPASAIDNSALVAAPQRPPSNAITAPAATRNVGPPTAHGEFAATRRAMRRPTPAPIRVTPAQRYSLSRAALFRPQAAAAVVAVTVPVLRWAPAIRSLPHVSIRTHPPLRQAAGARPAPLLIPFTPTQTMLRAGALEPAAAGGGTLTIAPQPAATPAAALRP